MKLYSVLIIGTHGEQFYEHGIEAATAEAALDLVALACGIIDVHDRKLWRYAVKEGTKE